MPLPLQHAQRIYNLSQRSICLTWSHSLWFYPAGGSTKRFRVCVQLCSWPTGCCWVVCCVGIYITSPMAHFCRRVTVVCLFPEAPFSLLLA